MMTVHEVTWGEVDPGALVVDANGQHWRVHDKRVQLPQMAFLIAHDDVATWVVHGYSDEVVLVDETAGQAVETVMAALGGSVIVEPLPTAPNRPSVRAKYRAHLYHFHGISVPLQESEAKGAGGTPERSLDELVRLHAVSHASPENHLIPHTHQPIGGQP